MSAAASRANARRRLRSRLATVNRLIAAGKAELLLYPERADRIREQNSRLIFEAESLRIALT